MSLSTDFTDLRGEAGTIAAITASAAAACAATAAYFHSTSKGAASTRKSTLPRLSKQQLLETLTASLENAKKSQEDAFRDVVLSDSSESSGFVARFRRRAAPTFDSVVEKFNKSLAARDSALLETRGLKESDVDYALRYYCNDAAVRAAEAAVLATAPLAAAAHPVRLAGLLSIEGDIDIDALDDETGGGEDDVVAAGSNLVKAASIAELLEAITDAAPSHFQTAVMGVMQASPGGQPGPNFLTQATLTARGLATKEVLAGGPWEERPNTFEFVVELHRAADTPLGTAAGATSFKSAHTAGMSRNFAQLRTAMESGPGDEEGEGEE